MEIQKGLCGNEMRKIALLMKRAADDEIDLSGYGNAGMNSSSGDVYLYFEDERSCLYIGLDGTDKIRYLRTCSNCGNEIDVPRKKRNIDMKCAECGEDM